MAGKFIRIDDQCRTSMRGIYAIGDVTGEPMLAHRAMAQGEMVAEIVAGHKRSWDKRCIPAVCFTDPEIVSAGLSPDEAQGAGREIKIGLFPFAANGRAMTMLGEDGFVRVVARADNHLVLGIQAVGQGVSELSAAFALAIEMGARLEDIAGTIHAHPTRARLSGSGAEGAGPRAAYLTGRGRLTGAVLVHCSCGFLRKLLRSADLTRSHVSRPSRTTRMGTSAPAGPLLHTLR